MAYIQSLSMFIAYYVCINFFESLHKKLNRYRTYEYKVIQEEIVSFDSAYFFMIFFPLIVQEITVIMVVLYNIILINNQFTFEMYSLNSNSEIFIKTWRTILGILISLETLILICDVQLISFSQPYAHSCFSLMNILSMYLMSNQLFIQEFTLNIQ